MGQAEFRTQGVGELNFEFQFSILNFHRTDNLQF